MDMVNVKVLDQSYEFPMLSTLEDVYLKLKDNYSNPVMVGMIDNEIHELSYKITKDCSVTFIDSNDRVGNRIYQKGLIFLLSYAVHCLYGNSKHIKVCHSIDRGIRIKSDSAISSVELDNISSKMNEIVSSKLEITKCLVRKKEAINYFLSNGDITKASSLKYLTNHYINLYKLGDIYNYLYSYMPVNTSYLSSFKLTRIDDFEFLLLFPIALGNGVIPDYVSREKIVQAYNENYKLAKKLDIFTSSDINQAIATGRINDIIRLTEVVANNNLLNLAQEIYNRKDKLKLVLIAGPSSSGKTTTARKLSMFLKSFGLNPKPLSIDDYFVDRVNTPKLPNGDYDYESINAIDLKLFNDQLMDLLSNKEVSVPTYNFVTGEKEYLNKNLKLESNDILIVEGLHGLNEKLTSLVPKENKLKVYVSPFTDLNIDNLNMVSTSDVRLLRRIVRDSRTRGYSAVQTIKNWKNVREGEEKNIFPYQQEADYVYNSALVYEVGVLKLYAEPLLFDIDNTSLYYEEVRRLINFLSMFLSMPTDSIPSDSILREFIGGSYFE